MIYFQALKLWIEHLYLSDFSGMDGDDRLEKIQNEMNPKIDSEMVCLNIKTNLMC